MTETEKFFLKDIPEAFNIAIEAMTKKIEEAEASSDPTAATKRSQLDAMKQLETTLRVEMTGEGGRDYYVNQSGGALTVDEEAKSTPVLWITQDVAHFEALWATGVNALGVGVGDTAKSVKPINPSVVDQVKAFDNVIKVVIEGVGDVGEAVTLIRLGEGTDRDNPDMTVNMALEDCKEMAAGRLLPPQAFMMGKLRIDGDMSLAMRLATLAVS